MKKFYGTEQLCYNTVRIEAIDNNGHVSYGTGFIYQFDLEQGYLPVIITNKHVVKNAKSISFVLREKDADDNPIDNSHTVINIHNIQKDLKWHPDQNVDLCALRFAPVSQVARERGKKLFYITLDKNVLPTSQELDDLSAFEEILMIGYPISLWDNFNNMPILRKGSTATHPNMNYAGRKEFMIDAACFPGSSGSPVYIYDKHSYSTRSGTTHMISTSRIKLLGILYAGPQYSVNGKIEIINIPTSQELTSSVSVPTNLGFVIKSERILELLDLFVLSK